MNFKSLFPLCRICCGPQVSHRATSISEWEPIVQHTLEPLVYPSNPNEE